MAFVKVSVFRGTAEISEFLHMADRHGAVVCGGYPRYCCSPKKDPIPAGDVDFFPKTMEGLASLQKELEGLGYKVAHENHVSITMKYEGTDQRWALKPTPQVIKPVREGKIMTVGTIEEILENFDFTVVRVALVKVEACAVCNCGREAHDTESGSLCLCGDCSGFIQGAVAWAGIADDQFEEDEKNTFLRLQNIHCPISSLLRCLKYGRKGYWMGPAEALKLFQDWDKRGPQYKEDMVKLFTASSMGQISQKQIDELEDLLRVD